MCSPLIFVEEWQHPIQYVTCQNVMLITRSLCRRNLQFCLMATWPVWYRTQSLICSIHMTLLLLLVVMRKSAYEQRNWTNLSLTSSSLTRVKNTALPNYRINHVAILRPCPFSSACRFSKSSDSDSVIYKSSEEKVLIMLVKAIPKRICLLFRRFSFCYETRSWRSSGYRGDWRAT